MCFSANGIAHRLQSFGLLLAAPRTATDVATARTLPARPRRLLIISGRRFEVEPEETAFAVLFSARFDGVVDPINVAADNDAVQSLFVFTLMAAQHRFVDRLIEHHPVPVSCASFHRLHIRGLGHSLSDRHVF
jgi:hypothetical protein